MDQIGPKWTKNGSKWIEWIEVDQMRMKWIEVDRIDRNGLNGPK